MRVVGRESCGCGASIETEMQYPSDVCKTLDGFREAHAECRTVLVAPQASSSPTPWYWPWYQSSPTVTSSDSSGTTDYKITINAPKDPPDDLGPALSAVV